MKSLAELSLRRPVTAVMVFVSLVVIGLLAAFRLPLEQFPDVNVPFVFVSVPYPGSTPQEVERQITRPVEEALSTLPGISMMNSTSRADNAGIFLMRADRFLAELPGGVQLFSLLKANPALMRLLADIMGTAPRLARGSTRCSRGRRTMAADRDFWAPRAWVDGTWRERVALRAPTGE